MRTELTIQELAEELASIKEAKRDFIVDTRALTVAQGDGPGLAVAFDGGETYPIRRHALRQIEKRLKIPADYAERLLTKHPDLLCENINTLFAKEPERRLVRVLDDHVRAFMSDSYRIMDNYDLAEAVLPQLVDAGAEIQSCAVTERKMYIKAILPGLTKEFGPPPGKEMGVGHHFFIEKVVAGITISNSEIGSGRLTVQPSVFTSRCTNWCAFDDQRFAKVHLGAKQGDSDASLWEVFSDDTKKMSDATLWSQVRDITTAAMDGRLFEKIVAKLVAARADSIEGDPVKAIQATAELLDLTEGEQGTMLRFLIDGGDLSRYGVHSAVTRVANDVESYDRASDLERAGARIIDLPPQDWSKIALAA